MTGSSEPAWPHPLVLSQHLWPAQTFFLSVCTEKYIGEGLTQYQPLQTMKACSSTLGNVMLLPWMTNAFEQQL